MIIEYRNWFNEKLTQEEVDSLDRFKIIYIDEINDDVKRINWIDNKKVDAIRYYIGENEREADIVHSLSSKVDTAVVISETEVINSLKLDTHREYRNGELTFMTKILHDNKDNTICYQPIDLISNQIIHSETEKYYYINNDYEVLHATYKKDGSLEYVMYMPTYYEQSWESYAIDTINELEIIMGINLDYYHNSNIN